MKYIILLLLMLSFVSAGCVDINSATLEELDEIVGVGEAYAGRIMEDRPFDSVDDLIKVKGIGPITLEKIKTQDLACVNGEVEEFEGVEEDFEEEGEEIEKVIENEKDEEIVLSPEPPKMISLNANGDSELIYESKDSRIMNFLPYVFSVFLIGLVGILFLERF